MCFLKYVQPICEVPPSSTVKTATLPAGFCLKKELNVVTKERALRVDLKSVLTKHLV